MDLLIQYQWELFILAEVLSIVSILLFGLIRYLFHKRTLSLLFLGLFLVLLILEAVLAFVLYQETGNISTFQIIIIIFIAYACTFGISDFRKLDRWMRLKIGNWRGIELLSEKDKYIMERQKNPKYIAKKNRINSFIHMLIFIIFQAIFWFYSLEEFDQVVSYITDLSWIGTENVTETPYANDIIYGISMIWGLVFMIDFIYSWSYTIFPSKQRGE